MLYQKWKENVMEELVKAGFERGEALVKANSIRGLYYSETKHPQPLVVVNNIVQSLSPLERVWLRHSAKKREASQRKGYAITSQQIA